MKNTIKKILSTALVVVMCFSFAPLQAFLGAETTALVVKASATDELAPAGQCGDNVYWSFDSATGELVISGTGDMYYWDCWSGNGTPSPFMENNAIKIVVIKYGVTDIPGDTFLSCSNLTDVKISKSVTFIGIGAFANCISLTNLIIPDSVTEIGGDAFSGCDNLTKVCIGNGLNVIPIYVFSNCHNLTSVAISNSVTNISRSAFSACEKLTDIYYSGSEEQWLQIDIANYNETLFNATIHYNHKHTFETASVASTCTEEGYTTYTCVCGYTETEIVSPTGHTDTDNDGKCEVCSEVFREPTNKKGTFDFLIDFFKAIIDFIKNIFKF